MFYEILSMHNLRLFLRNLFINRTVFAGVGSLFKYLPDIFDILNVSQIATHSN